ncbi:MAG TPA: YihY/virulence factor BrkB family protein [Opitutus sp.]|nr:YihY/virulence factor BrkB family protein [Opitutus sp.]
MRWFADRWKRLAHLYQKGIWEPGQLQGFSLRGTWCAILRVVSITWTVFNETKAASRAAALSFSSLLGLGPLVALTVLVAGFALDNRDPNLAANALSRLINFVAPQVGQYGKLDSHRSHDADTPEEKADEAATADGRAPASASPDAAPAASAPATEIAANTPDVRLNPRLVRMINNFVSQGRSGSAGTLGFFSLILIVLLLFKTIEDTFNEIWGVRSGRSLLMRIIYYWTILTLGAVLFFASVTLLSAGAFLSVFNEAIAHLPFSQQVSVALQWSLPAFSFTLLVVLLTVFYRIIPNTRVYWRAAFAGAAVVASLLMLNNFLAFLYVRRVILTESLYGSIGFPLVVMFGLYIFWLYVLIGGQISYAIQNVRFRNSQAAWSSLSEAMRERLLLVVLLTICRRFRDCLPPVAASQLGTMIKVPTQILNECLNRLVDLKLITPLPAARADDPSDLLYQPARPLNRITLFDFKTLDDNFGEDPVGTSLETIDPILLRYTQAMNQLAEQSILRKSLEELLAEHPFDESRPPFAMGTSLRR